jgi:hypothetical protein
METPQIRILWGVGSWAGCVLASKAIELDRERLRNLRGETEIEFVRNSKVLVDFKVRTWIPKKASSMPRPRPQFRPRFSDLSFHSQPYLRLRPTSSQLLLFGHFFVGFQRFSRNLKEESLTNPKLFKELKSDKCIVNLLYNNNKIKSNVRDQVSGANLEGKQSESMYDERVN